MNHNMKLMNAPFLSMKEGEKDIETRFYDEKRRAISIGDTITFEHIETKELLIKKVVNLHVFNTFEELFRSFPAQRFGWEDTEDLINNRYDESIGYTAEKEHQFGVVGIVLK